MASLLVCIMPAVVAMEWRVATFAGSKYLDKRGDVEVAETGTVGDLKMAIEHGFPGNPPYSLQRVYLGSRLLEDDEELASLEGDSVLLDLVPIDAAGKPPDATLDRLKAYVAETVALEHLWALFRDADAPRSEKLARDVRDLERALVDEHLAAVVDDNAKKLTSGALRTGFDDVKSLPDWKRTMAVVLNIHWRETLKITAALVAAAQFGVKDKFRQTILLTLVPALYVSQTRPARFLLKLLWYALPTMPHNSFFAVFFGAPQQLMLSIDTHECLKILYLPQPYHPAHQPGNPAFKTRFVPTLYPSSSSHTFATALAAAADDADIDDDDGDDVSITVAL